MQPYERMTAMHRDAPKIAVDLWWIHEDSKPAPNRTLIEAGVAQMKQVYVSHEGLAREHEEKDQRSSGC